MSQKTTTERPAGAVQTVQGGTGDMFDAIAERYDLLNRILSLGQDQYWRKKAVKALQLDDASTVLDLATGTGDLAIMIARMKPKLTVRGVDPSANMIAVGQEKVKQQALTERVTLSLGDGLAIPFEDDTFDGAVVSFGIRNFPDRLKGLQEMTRVTRPGRKVVVLELSEPRKGLMAVLARTYIHHIVPTIGATLSGKQEYRYLQRSIAAFPTAEEFVALMHEAGLKDASSKALSFGAVNLFVGTVA